jgi:anti-sigma factor RsiW
MISTHLAEEILQQLHDGELETGGEEEARQHLQECAQCRERLNRLERLHDLIRLAAEDMSSRVDFEALYGRIAEGVSQEKRGAGEPVSLQGWRARLKDSGPQVWLPMAFAAALAIAFIAKIASTGGEDAEMQAGDKRARKTMLASAPGKSAGRLPEMASPQGEEPPNSEISQVDFGDSNGTVFEIALADGISTPVVWINDEPQDTVAP